jgi:hypothetical protein
MPKQSSGISTGPPIGKRLEEQENKNNEKRKHRKNTGFTTDLKFI